MKVELLTPLHIGTGNEVPEFEYRLDGAELIRISLASLLASDPGAVEVLNEFATRAGVMRYLDSKSDLWDHHLLYYLRGEIEDFDETCEPETVVRECVKASFGNYPLLPGSSLKGALLTGWLFGEGWENLSQIEQANLRQSTITKFEVSLEREVYDKLSGKNPEWGFRSRDRLPNLLSDRLWISDIELTGDFEIRQAIRKIKRETFDPWIECIATGASGARPGRFRQEGNGKRTVEELCRRCNIFAECLVMAERQFFAYCLDERKRYIKEMPAAYTANSPLFNHLNEAQKTKNTCVVRIGWASNKNAASLTLLNSNGDLFNQPPGTRSPRRRPKSRWSMKDGTPFGWCVVTFEEGDYE